MKVLNSQDVLLALGKLNSKRTYAAMYSSLYDGIVTDPALMVLPIDEHMVHRGDGVFEAIRFTPKKIYLLDEHLKRLARSGDKISLKMPFDILRMSEICQRLREISGLQEGILRLFVGRGPGDFSPNPYSTVGSQFYVVVTAFQQPANALYENGAKLMVSDVPIKPAPYSQVKSCNYLQNVMMKKQSVDKGYDFSINLNEDGFVAEGPTENIAIVDADGVLCAPKFEYTLRGTTLVRAFELAEKNRLFAKMEIRDLKLAELRAAREVMMVGTTLGVLPVTSLDGVPVGAGAAAGADRVTRGAVGEGAKRLGEVVRADMYE